MIVCLCHRVSDRDIAREVDRGCASFEELQERTRTGTGCGACLEFAQEHFEALAPAGAAGAARLACAGSDGGCTAARPGACGRRACSGAPGEERQRQVALERGFELQEHALALDGVCSDPRCRAGG